MRTLCFAILCLSQITHAQKSDVPPAKVSYDDFMSLVLEVEPHRAQRLVDFNAFLRMSKQKDVIILDTRSKDRYDRKHLKGAVHLAFTDFTQENLARVIPDFNTRILIYCNNNFEGDRIDFASKVASPTSVSSETEFPDRPKTLALNIPTYINLYGYGYTNVYELSELVDVKDPRVVFEGSAAIMRLTGGGTIRLPMTSGTPK